MRFDSFLYCQNTNPYYWLWGGLCQLFLYFLYRADTSLLKVNRWVSTRFNLLSSVIVGVTGVVALINPNISASLAGFTLAFASTVTNDVSCLLVASFFKLNVLRAASLHGKFIKVVLKYFPSTSALFRFAGSLAWNNQW